MKKHAILLLAHNEPQYLMDLIDLFDENFYFFIHLDKHCDFSVEDIEKIKNNYEEQGSTNNNRNIVFKIKGWSGVKRMQDLQE